MSVRVMALVFEADIQDMPYEKDGEKRNAKASTVKLLLLAYADHSNDEGEAAYPGYTLLERKTALSRQGIADTLEAVQQNGFMTLVGKSKRDTNNYQINVEKLEELVKPLDYQKTVRVKPLDQHESSHLTSTSQATGLNPSITTPNHPLGAEAPARTAQQKKGDIMDGILHFAALAADPATALKAKVQEFPADVQDTIQALAEIYRWPAGSIPAKPRGNSKGGSYAQWINEARTINQIISGFGREALESTYTPCKKLSISHPGAVLWCLPAEVGKLSQRAPIEQSPDPEPTHTRPDPKLRANALARLGATR